MSTSEVLAEVQAKRDLNFEFCGEVDWPDGARSFHAQQMADSARLLVEHAKDKGGLTWRHILAQEYDQVQASTERTQLRESLLRLAAETVAWIEAIDRRDPATARPPQAAIGDRWSAMIPDPHPMANCGPLVLALAPGQMCPTCGTIPGVDTQAADHG